MRWLLTSGGQVLHRPHDSEGSLSSICGQALSRSRTDDHDREFGVEYHPRCKRCVRYQTAFERQQQASP